MATTEFTAAGKRRGRGRPRKSKTERRSEAVLVRLTLAEKAQLEESGNELGISVQDLMRDRSLLGRARPRSYKRNGNTKAVAALTHCWTRIEKLDTDFDEVKELLAREGNVVNQLARDHHTDGRDPELEKWSHLPKVIEGTQEKVLDTVGQFEELRGQIAVILENLVDGMPIDD